MFECMEARGSRQAPLEDYVQQSRCQASGIIIRVTHSNESKTLISCVQLVRCFPAVPVTKALLWLIHYMHDNNAIKVCYY